MEEPHGRISVKIVQHSSENGLSWVIFRLFQLGISKVSRELESSKRKADGLYAPNMGLTTS